jgi:fructan beta-fructosidase
MPQKRRRLLLNCAFVLVALGQIRLAAAVAADRPDLVMADFEGDTYAGWVADGEAFGKGPSRGTLPGQMAVSGFLGRGLVNSFVGGDGSTGTLTSPPVRIERPYLSFLIGGGQHPGSTCLNLLIDGKVARTASGPNDKPGGSEQLEWASWDVRELIGKTVVFQIVDHETGGWGHITIDQIVQSDRVRGLGPLHRELVAKSRYLHLPVRNDAPLRRLRVSAGGSTVREFDIKLAEDQPSFQLFLDLKPFEGQTVALDARLPADSKALERVSLANEIPDAGRLYREPRRPQFHFTSRRGWLNDPNGLLWFEGEYHLFYQHNPYGWDWGNMHWGHAVSPDLVHWTELPIALYPKEYGDWAFSGSAVVDRRNTSGFGTAGTPPLIMAFTSTGRGECIAFSNDRGRSWTEFEGNPVVKHSGRDPRLLWHGPTNRWVMAVYDETGGGRRIAFHSSPDLKAWTFESQIDGFFECPELFEMPVEGLPGKTLWVVHAADGQYQLGKFDGHRFVPESGKLRTWYGNFYASQTFSDTPDNRRIQIGWGNGITFPGEPFNQQMTVPCELKLRSTPAGVRMLARPVAELAVLRAKTHRFDGQAINPRDHLNFDPTVSQFDVRAEVEVGADGGFALNIAGTPVVYDAIKKTLACGDVIAPLAPEGKFVRLRILVDRGSLEIFGNDGQVAISRAFAPIAVSPSLALTLTPSVRPVKIRSFQVDELESAWKSRR